MGNDDFEGWWGTLALEFKSIQKHSLVWRRRRCQAADLVADARYLPAYHARAPLAIPSPVISTKLPLGLLFYNLNCSREASYGPRAQTFSRAQWAPLNYPLRQ